MKKLPQIVLLSSLLVLTVQNVYAADSYVDALSSEATDTKMKATTTSATDDGPEPAVTASSSEDTDALASKVGNQLEKLLSGSAGDDVTTEDLVNIVSEAVKEGHEIDDIQSAVSAAMADLQKKEGVNIKPEVFEFAAKSVSDIVSSSKDVAQGDPNDPYIQSLNAEVDDTSLKDDESKDNKAEEKVAETKTDNAQSDEKVTEKTPVEEKSEVDAKQETAEVDKPEKSDASPASTDTTPAFKGSTIIVLKGESLSKIAAKIYGSGRKYHLLYEANRDTLSNPDSIAIGQVLKVPPLPSE